MNATNTKPTIDRVIPYWNEIKELSVEDKYVLI